MATNITIIRDGHEVKCVYPNSGFATMFAVTDKSYRWLEGNVKYALGVKDQKALISEVDSAINNIENLDLA